MQGQARHSQFNAFKRLANGAGFGKVRQADLRTRALLDTDGAQEAGANVAWSLEFFDEGSAAALMGSLAHKTREPNIRANTPMGNEYLFCARALTLEVEHQTPGHSEAELMEIALKLSKSVIQVYNGSDIIYERRAGYILSGSAGVDVSQGDLAAGAATGVRGRLHPMREGDDLDDPVMIFPGASIRAVLNGEGAWTSTDDVYPTLTLHGWVAMRGAVEAGAGILSLQDAIANPSLVTARRPR
ncbi:MAG: hypothetical protein IT382_01885 [Deltaproteobacteria bacterium]|nr:hypothetical protein [Deltaproteobacteria bacterium]